MAKTSANRQEMRRLGDSELLGRLGEARRELFNLRFQLATGQLDNSARISAVKKDIARLSTFLREREIAAAEALEEGANS
jgi:large subunit ribosomal protein L29